MNRFLTLFITVTTILSFLTLCSCDVYENNSSNLNNEDKETIETSYCGGWNDSEYINSIDELMLAIKDWDAFSQLGYIDLDRIDLVKTNLELLVECSFPYIEDYSDFYIRFECESGCVTVCFTTTDGIYYSFIYLFSKEQAHVEADHKFGKLNIGNQQVEMFSLTNHNSSVLANTKQGIWRNSGVEVIITAYGKDLESSERFTNFNTIDLIELASEYDFAN